MTDNSDSSPKIDELLEEWHRRQHSATPPWPYFDQLEVYKAAWARARELEIERNHWKRSYQQLEAGRERWKDAYTELVMRKPVVIRELDGGLVFFWLMVGVLIGTLLMGGLTWLNA